MSLKKQIEEKLNQALKSKDKSTYPTLRLVVSAIKDAEIAARTKGQKEMSDSDIMAILKKMIKQRNESCEVYEKAGRKELLENEKKEIKLKPEMLNLLGCSKENFIKLIENMDYKTYNKNDEIFFKYSPKKKFRKINEKNKITVDNPFNVLKEMSIK